MYDETKGGKLSSSSNCVRLNLEGEAIQSYSEPLFFKADETYYLSVSSLSGPISVEVWGMKQGKSVGKLIHQGLAENENAYQFNQTINSDLNLVLNLSCLDVSPNQCRGQGMLSRMGIVS